MDARFLQLLESGTKVLTATVGALYVGGFLVVNTHLGNNGFNWLGLFAPTYLPAGTWAILPLLAGGFLAFLIVYIQRHAKKGASLQSQTKEFMDPESRMRRLFGVGSLLSSVVLAYMAMGPVLLAIGFDHMLSVVGIAGLTIHIVKVFFRLERVLSLVGSCMLFGWLSAGAYRALGYIGVQPSLIWLAFVAVGAAIFLLVYLDDAKTAVAAQNAGTHSNVNGLILLLFALPVYFTWFGYQAYGDIPLRLGGGAPARVTLIAGSDEQLALKRAGVPMRGDDAVTKPVHLFLATNEELLIKPTMNGDAVVLRRDAVDAVIIHRLDRNAEVPGE